MSALLNVAYVLRRVGSDPEFFHHMAHTQSLRELVEAFVELGGETEGLDVERLVETINRRAPRREAGCAKNRETLSIVEPLVDATITYIESKGFCFVCGSSRGAPHHDGCSVRAVLLARGGR